MTDRSFTFVSAYPDSVLLTEAGIFVGLRRQATRVWHIVVNPIFPPGSFPLMPAGVFIAFSANLDRLFVCCYNITIVSGSWRSDKVACFPEAGPQASAPKGCDSSMRHDRTPSTAAADVLGAATGRLKNAGVSFFA